MEVEKMDLNYFVSVQRELSSIEKHAQCVDPVLGQLQLYKMELRFCFTTWDDTDEEIRIRLSSIITSLQGIWGKQEENGLLAPRLLAIHTGDVTVWHLLAFELEENIRLSKLEIEAWWIKLFHRSLQCKLSTSYKIVKFLNLILDNLSYLVSYKFPNSSLYNYPKIISPRFLDFLIQNLRNLEERMISDRKYVPFAQYKITKIKGELITLCLYLSHNCNCQSEQNETWLEAVNLVYLTEHVISSCISSWFIVDHPIWYHIAYLSDVSSWFIVDHPIWYLSDVFGRISFVKTKLEEIEKNTTCNASCLPPSTCFFSTLSKQARPSKIDEIFVGFEDEVEKIVGKLIKVHNRPLDIISIFGMGGLGKTIINKKKL